MPVLAKGLNCIQHFLLWTAFFSVEFGYTVMPSRLNHYFYKVCHDFVKVRFVKIAIDLKSIKKANPKSLLLAVSATKKNGLFFVFIMISIRF